jgi:hypothetical protein
LKKKEKVGKLEQKIKIYGIFSPGESLAAKNQRSRHHFWLPAN